MNDMSTSKMGTSTEPGTVRLERLLPGPIERVWAYLTESDKRATWFAAGTFDLLHPGHLDYFEWAKRHGDACFQSASALRSTE